MAWHEETANALAAGITNLPIAHAFLNQAHNAPNDVVALDSLIKAKGRLMAMLAPIELAQTAIMRQQAERAAPNSSRLFRYGTSRRPR